MQSDNRVHIMNILRDILRIYAMNQTMKVILFTDYANGVDPLKFTNLNIGAGTKNGPSNRFNDVKFGLQATLKEFRTGRTSVVQNMNK